MFLTLQTSLYLNKSLALPSETMLCGFPNCSDLNVGGIAFAQDRFLAFRINPLSPLHVTNALFFLPPIQVSLEIPHFLFFLLFSIEGCLACYLSEGLKGRFNFWIIQGGSWGVSFPAPLTSGPAQIEFHACLLICR